MISHYVQQGNQIYIFYSKRTVILLSIRTRISIHQPLAICTLLRLKCGMWSILKKRAWNCFTTKLFQEKNVKCLYTLRLTSAWSKDTLIFCLSAFHAYFTLALVCIWRSPQSYSQVFSFSSFFPPSALSGEGNVCRTEVSIQLNLFILHYNDFLKGNAVFLTRLTPSSFF